MPNTQINKSVQKNAGTENITKMTFSAWIKRSELGEGIIIAAHQLSSYYSHLYFNSDDRIQVYSYINAQTAANLVTERRFRDINAWYHIVFTVDTTLGTSTDRMKIYVNGERETVFNGGTTFPAQDSSFGQFSDTGATLNLGNTANRAAFGGSMSHVHYIPYTAYDASAFGETDATTGEWKIKTSPSVTYSTAGFFLFKDKHNGTNTVTDESGNNNDFTVANGSLTGTEDSPSNIFCTGNPLARYSGNLNFTYGNNYITSPANNWTMGSCNLGAATGKWYWEMKILVNGTGNGYFKMGFISDQAHATNTGHIAESALDGGYAFYCQNGNLEVRNDDAVISGYAVSDLNISFTTGDIMCLAVDMDNKRAYFRKNDGSWIKSANPVSGTNGLDISGDYTAGKAMIPAFAIYYPGQAAANFGNGYFGTSQVSSAGTNASGNGIFEYDVPTGYTALSTKGLNL